MEHSDQSYFACRQVSSETYRDFQLAGYLRSVLPSGKEAPILDIGCGLGQVLERLAAEGYSNLLGVDVSAEAMDACRRRGLTAERIGDLESFCVSSTRRFKLVMMSHVLEHLEKTAMIPVLKAIRNHLLDEEGGLLVVVPNAQSNTGCYWAYEDFTHHTLFTAGSLLYVLRAAGYTDIRILDPDGLGDSKGLVKWAKRVLLKLYCFNRWFWNKVTGSSYHKPSPAVFTFDVKMLAR